MAVQARRSNVESAAAFGAFFMPVARAVGFDEKGAVGKRPRRASRAGVRHEGGSVFRRRKEDRRSADRFSGHKAGEEADQRKTGT